MNQVKTRNVTDCPIFSFPQDLKETCLPTYKEVMQCYLFIRHELKPFSNSKEPSVSDISENVAVKLEKIWRKSSIPIVSHKRILQLIKSYHDKYRCIMKPYKERKHVPSYQQRLQAFKDQSLVLFDICSCKCADFNMCSCEKNSKVPIEERNFLHDQRNERKMAIGSVDVKSTIKKIKRDERFMKEKLRLSRSLFCKTPACKTPTFDDSSDEAMEEDSIDSRSNNIKTNEQKNDNIDNVEPQPGCSHSLYQVIPAAHQMRLNLPSLAVACDRTGVSDRSAAMIASAVLQDVGLISNENTNLVIDRSKVRRERSKMRTDFQSATTEPVVGLYFDGRKDKTLSQEKKGNKFHRKVTSESHYSLISEPHSTYIGHVTSQSGKAEDVAKDILHYLKENNIDLSQLCAIGCDGTVVNTGFKGGIIRYIELNQKKPLQWLICQLHANELPLRHLLIHLDGETTGPEGFSGVIGKQLKECEKLTIVNFVPIETELPKINIKSDLSTDQKYLYEIMTAVADGNCSTDLANKYPGHMSHSRWLTTANRILRLYVSTEVAGDKLNTLATFIMKVYGPMWFKIKTNPLCTSGAQHVMDTIKMSRYLDEDLRKIVDPVIQRNAYFAHPENIILCMLVDERKVMREVAYRRVLKARAAKPNKVRPFVIPDLNFDATSYGDLIDWTTVVLTEPPLLAKLTEEELQDIVSIGLQTELPCHTQAVERCVKLVTEASEAVCDPKARDGFIRSRLASRKKMPCFETKKHYTM